MRAIGALWLAIAARGSVNSGVEIFVSIRLLRLISPSLKSKNVCHPMKRRGARKPLRRSLGSFPFSGVMSPRAGSKMNPKNGFPLSPLRFARYDGRTIVWPNRKHAPWNSTGIVAWPLSG